MVPAAGRAAIGLGIRMAIRRARRQRAEADLAGQVAVVTGGSRGLGLLIARELGAAGCKIAICARDASELERARQTLSADGIDVLAVPCNMADRLEVEHLVDTVMHRFGRIDIVVNNAGIIQVGPLASMLVSDFEEAMGVMFWGPLYLTMAVLPQMRARKSGRIVNITSIGGKVSVPHLLPYGAAKFAAVGLSEGLHAELMREGITVTTIAPGLMRTGSYLNALFKGRQGREYTWFALGSSLPLISMDAERAAHQIVTAIRRGEAECILSLPAQALAGFHGLFPGTTADILGLVNRFVLPNFDGGDVEAAPGKQMNDHPHSRLLDLLMTLGRSAARRFQE